MARGCGTWHCSIEGGLGSAALHRSAQRRAVIDRRRDSNRRRTEPRPDPGNPLAPGRGGQLRAGGRRGRWLWNSWMCVGRTALARGLHNGSRAEEVGGSRISSPAALPEPSTTPPRLLPTQSDTGRGCFLPSPTRAAAASYPVRHGPRLLPTQSDTGRGCFLPSPTRAAAASYPVRHGPRLLPTQSDTGRGCFLPSPTRAAAASYPVRHGPRLVCAGPSDALAATPSEFRSWRIQPSRSPFCEFHRLPR